MIRVDQDKFVNNALGKKWIVNGAGIYFMPDTFALLQNGKWTCFCSLEKVAKAVATSSCEGLLYKLITWWQPDLH